MRDGSGSVGKQCQAIPNSGEEVSGDENYRDQNARREQQKQEWREIQSCRKQAGRCNGHAGKMKDGYG